MKTKKKIALFLAVIFILSAFAAIFTVSASAVKPTDNDGELTIKEYETIVRAVNNANKTIERLVKIAQLTPYNDVPVLLVAVDIISASVFSLADKLGATVECEYVEYYIDGQYVLIDPIRVINVRPVTEEHQ